MLSFAPCTVRCDNLWEQISTVFLFGGGTLDGGKAGATLGVPEKRL